MAKYLLSEASFIHGFYYPQGDTVEVADDLRPAMVWIPLDDAAKRAVDIENKVRAQKGLRADDLPSIDQLIERLCLAGYAVTTPEGGEIQVTVAELGKDALLLDNETVTTKKVR